MVEKKQFKTRLTYYLLCAIIDIGMKRISLLRIKPQSKGKKRWRNKSKKEEIESIIKNVKIAEGILNLLDKGEEYDGNFIGDMINHQFCNFEQVNMELISDYLKILQEIAEPFTTSMPEISELEKSLYEYRPDDRILVCTFSNTAIKVLKQRLISKGIDSIQIYGKIQEEADENIRDPDSLHYKLRNSEEYKKIGEAMNENINKLEKSRHECNSKLRAYDEGKELIRNLLKILKYFNSQWRERKEKTKDIEYLLEQLENYLKRFEYQRQMLLSKELLIDNIKNSVKKLIKSLLFFKNQSEAINQQEIELIKIEKSVKDLIDKLNTYFNDLKTPETMEGVKAIKEKLSKLDDNLKILQKKTQDEKIDFEKTLISQYKVICCTCLSSYGPRLNGFVFRHILIDEATQALEPVSALCLLKKPVHLILLGDPRQLGCLVKYSPNTELGLGVPMIERLIDSDIPHYLLSQQYRMHPDIAEFSNRMFYANQIQNTVTAA